MPQKSTPMTRLQRSIASLEKFDCRTMEVGSQADGRDVANLAQVLGSTLEEAHAGQISWADREAIILWLQSNIKFVPTVCAGLCGQLETRLTFAFLPGLSWPGYAAVGETRGGRDQNKRRNLAGLSPPRDKNASDFTPVVPPPVVTSTAHFTPALAGRGLSDDGNYSSTDDEAAAGVTGLGMSSRDTLGSPEMLPSVLEQDTNDMSTPQEADDAFLLQPTPLGMKSYCMIQRTRSTIRTYYRLFLQEQRPFRESCPTPPATGTAGVVPSSVIADKSTGSSAHGGAWPGKFLLSTKRYRSSRVRSASYAWNKNDVWKDKLALAKVATHPWGGKGEGSVTYPTLQGDRARSLASSSSALTSTAATAPSTTSTASPASGAAMGGAGSPGEDGLDGKARSPALSGSSGGGAGGMSVGGGSGAGGSEGSGCRGAEESNAACWAVVVNVQSEGEARLLSVAAIVPDPGNASAASHGSAGAGCATDDPGVEAALTEGLRTWERTGVVPKGTVVLRSKQPQWSAWQACHTLEFDGGDERVREPSRKNVSMVDVQGNSGASHGGRTRGRGKNDGTSGSTGGGAVVGGGLGGGGGTLPSAGSARMRRGYADARAEDFERGERESQGRSKALPPALQVGKLSEHQFSLDFCWPLSPLQAFVIAMSVFDV